MRAELGIWPVRVEAEKLGEVLAERLGGELIRPWRGDQLQEEESGRAESRQAESRQAESQKVRFREQFGQRSQWVLVMATGIAGRFVDGMLRDKHQDPAVVVLDEAGRYAVALVGGHEGGANALAYRVANAVGAIPVVTTATEAMKSLVVGIGCRKGVSEEQIERAVLYALGQRGVAGAGSATPASWLGYANSPRWISKRASRGCCPFRNDMGFLFGSSPGTDRSALVGQSAVRLGSAVGRSRWGMRALCVDCQYAGQARRTQDSFGRCRCGDCR